MPYFPALNDDVLLNVLYDLPIRDVLSISQTCRRLHTLIRDSLRLQFHLAAFAENYVLRPQSLTCTIPELDTFLREHTQHWARFEGKKKMSLSLPLPLLNKPMITYRQGVYIEADKNHYLVVQLNSDSAGEAPAPEKHPLPIVAFQTKAVLVDPDQDLMVLFTRDESLTVKGFCFTVGGLPHPKAPEYFKCGIHEPPPPLNNLHGLQYYEEAPVPCDVYSDIIGAAPSTDSGTDLRLWNWRTGRNMASLRVDKTYTSFNFLSRTTFLASAGYHRPPTLDYYSFDDSSIRLVRSLELPRIRDDRTFAFTTSVSNPIGQRSLLPIEARTHFIRISIDLSLSGFYNVVVDPSVLQDPTLSRGPEPIPWDTWGPQSTRWFSMDGNMYFGLHGPPCVHGSRIVIQRITDTNVAEGPYQYIIADFNIFASRREEALAASASAPTSAPATGQPRAPVHPAPLITATTPIIHPAFEDGQIECCLPFREVRVAGPFAQKPDWTWIDEERLVAHRHSHHLGTSGLDVVFMV